MSFPATFIRDAFIYQEWLEFKKGGEWANGCVRESFTYFDNYTHYCYSDAEVAFLLSDRCSMGSSCLRSRIVMEVTCIIIRGLEPILS